MTFWEWCQQNKITESEAKRLLQRRDNRFKQAYDRFNRPPYFGTSEQKGIEYEIKGN